MYEALVLLKNQRNRIKMSLAFSVEPVQMTSMVFTMLSGEIGTSEKAVASFDTEESLRTVCTSATFTVDSF